MAEVINFGRWQGLLPKLIGRKPVMPSSMTRAALCGIALERGWIRTVKHRDYTRSYVLTDAGRDVVSGKVAAHGF